MFNIKSFMYIASTLYTVDFMYTASTLYAVDLNDIGQKFVHSKFSPFFV